MKFIILNEFLQQSKDLFYEPKKTPRDIRIELLNEFKFNIVSATTTEAKEGVIIHYLSELSHIMINILDKYEIDFIIEQNSITRAFNSLFIEVEKYSYFFGFNIEKLSELTGFNIDNVPTIGFIIQDENETNEENFLDLKFNQGLEKIIFLHDLGVIDFLRKEYDNPSNSKLGEILKPITDLRPDTIRKYLERITNNEINITSKSVVSNIYNQLKITKKKS